MGTKESKAIDDIAAERRRQIEEEGWDAEHDNRHDDGELARAAAAFALSAAPGTADKLGMISRIWPFEVHWFKPRSRREDLVRAGALIAAEIDRLDRLAGPAPLTQQQVIDRLTWLATAKRGELAPSWLPVGGWDVGIAEVAQAALDLIGKKP